MNHAITRIMVIGFLLASGGQSFATSNTITTAESLLTDPSDTGWNLESMLAVSRAHRLSDSNFDKNSVSSNKKAHEPDNIHLNHIAQNKEVKALRRQIRSLKNELDKAQHQLAEMKASFGSNDNTELKPARAALQESKKRISILNEQIESLKDALADREHKTDVSLSPDDRLRHELADKKSELEKTNQELASLRSELARKEEQITSLMPPPGEKERVEALTFALQDRDNALAAALKRADDNNATLTSLHKKLTEKTKAVEDLRVALDARSAELKQAAAAMATLRAERENSSPVTSEQKQSYVAGLMMADGLNRRIQGWSEAGVKTDIALFRNGLEDGLRHKFRLKAPEARRAQATFMKAVQDGVTRKVADAQKQLASLAKGRHALKTEDGITWYSLREGKPVAPGRPVRLSMTEQVAGGKTVSKVPALTLREGDNVPAVVRGGMYLPGEGGEVVAYAMAQDVYGELPLPTGVQPYTIMEYHLKGEPLQSRRR